MTIIIELGSLRSDGTKKAYIKVSHQGTRKRIPTLVSLSSKEYSATKQGIKIKNLEKKKILDDQMKVVQMQFMDMSQEDYVINKVVDVNAIADAAKIKSPVSGQIIEDEERKGINLPPDFFEFTDQWLSICTLKGKKNYAAAVNSFKNYLQKTYLPFKDIKPMLVLEYQNSLANKPRAQSLYVNALSHLWEEADRLLDDEIPKSPFRKIKIARQKPVGQRATTINIIKKIYEYKGGGRAGLARDCFILSFCLMGMNAVDLYNCKYLKKGLLCYDRSKVKDRRVDKAHTEINVHDFILPIIKKYRIESTYVFDFHKRYCRSEDFSRALNIGLKQILGERTTVTFYSARHSWATIARNDCGIDKGTVNDALVHVDREMSITDLYIKKDYRLINEANKKVIEYVFGEYINKSNKTGK
ncbi:MAG: hypothetical protein PUH57_00335 [Prevotellaceae bacterium]|nr:hypothetical protein [Prevotellaceae bacterium]MDY2749360.1 hypothetical protein [Prevotella sp.]